MLPTKGAQKLREHEPSEAITNGPYLQSPRRQSSGSDDQRQAWIVGSICPSTSSEMHELGNLIVARQFCLRQLGRRQPTDELEVTVTNALELCAKGMAAFQQLHERMRR